MVLFAMPNTAVPVVCGVIEDGAGRVLVAQRPPHKHLGLKWEFPGGKVEAGESPENALQREIKEELNCDLIITRALPRFFHDYGTVLIEMIPFVCALGPASGPPTPSEHVAVRWMVPGELRTLELAAADGPILAHLT